MARQRGEFITRVGGAAAAWPLAARAQQAPKMARIGMLIPSGIDAPVTREVFGMVRQGLADRGYVEGKDIIFEQRGGDGTSEGLAASASELVSLKVDIIVAIATPAARAAQRSTATIPLPLTCPRCGRTRLRTRGRTTFTPLSGQMTSSTRKLRTQLLRKCRHDKAN